MTPVSDKTFARRRGQRPLRRRGRRMGMSRKMHMKRLAWAALLAAACLALAGCRFAVVEAGSVVIEAPTPTPVATEAP